MSDLFVSVVAIVPKPSQATTPTAVTKEVSGVHAQIQQNKVATPTGIPK